jgi:hypothetical protein
MDIDEFKEMIILMERIYTNKVDISDLKRYKELIYDFNKLIDFYKI